MANASFGEQEVRSDSLTGAFPAGSHLSGSRRGASENGKGGHFLENAKMNAVDPPIEMQWKDNFDRW